jgi:hypothetical protein
VLEKTCQILFLGAPLLLVAIAQGLSIKYGWLNRLKTPLDFGLRFRGKRILGDHKTLRGLVINVLFCTIGTMIQAWLQTKGYIPQWILLVDYTSHAYSSGICLGLGMTFGELPNSFLKRQLDILPGNKKKGLLSVVFFLFDQVDLAIGIWVFLFFFIRPSIWFILLSFLITILLHVFVSSVGYALGMRKTVV